MLHRPSDIFVEVDSNHFVFTLQNSTEEFSASTWKTKDHRAYIHMSDFDDNDELIIYFTSSIIGIYNVKFYTHSLDYSDSADPVSNGTYVIII